MFQIFSVIIETFKPPLFAKIEFDWDLEGRRAKIEVANVVRAHSEPIRNPVTDQEDRMNLVLPKGWVFHEAENASGFAKGFGAIKFDLNRRQGRPSGCVLDGDHAAVPIIGLLAHRGKFQICSAVRQSGPVSTGLRSPANLSNRLADTRDEPHRYARPDLTPTAASSRPISRSKPVTDERRGFSFEAD
jgi:hypothetical protein